MNCTKSCMNCENEESYEDALPSVSIIIPYYGDSIDQLSKCILAIEKQSYSKDRIEILVIDNNKSQKIDRQVISNECVKIIHEPRIGSYAARNKGIEVASGEALAFTDSDCIPGEHWLENGLIALAQYPGMTVVGGGIVFTFRNAAEPNIFELIDSTIHLRQIEYVRNMNYAATANLFSRRSMFEKFGNFDSNYRSGGDREWGDRLRENGVLFHYAPEAIVYHPARTTIRALINKNRRAVGGELLRLRRQGYSNARIFQEQLKAFFIRNYLLGFNIKITGVKSVLSKIVLIIIYFIRFAEIVRLLLGGEMAR